MPLPCSVSCAPARARTLLLSSLWVLALVAPCAGAEPPVEARVAECLQLRRNDPARALELAGMLLKTPGLSAEDQIKAISCQGMAASLLGRDDLAVASAALMEQRVRAHPSLAADLKLRAYSQAGAFYHGAGQIHRAEAAYLRAHDIAAGLGAEDAALTRLATLTNVGLIHADYLDSPEVADRYYRSAIAAGATVGHEDPLLLYNHAINLLRLDRQAEALAMLDRGEVVAAQQNNRIVVERIRSERAGQWIGEHRLAQARAALQQALSAQRQLGDPGGEALTLAKLSTLQRVSGDGSAALRSAQAAWELIKDKAEPQEQREVLLAWIGAHAALGQAEQTLAVGRRLHALEMNTMKQQRLDLLADLQGRSQNAASQRELERLRHEAQIRRLADERSRLLRNGVIVLLVLLMLAGVSLFVLQRRKNRQLRIISATDPLTGLKNRRAAGTALAAMAQQSRVPDSRHVLLLIDIDYFKAVNDTLGHHAGDAALVELSRRLKEACRPGDIVARWGGEEFLVACADINAAQACAFAERLQGTLGGLTQLAADRSWPLTVSVGFSPFPFFQPDAAQPEADWGYALRMADRALYAAKDHRDAWVGLWGQTLPDTLSAADVLEEPQQAVRAGAIEVMSSHAVAGVRT